MDARYEEVAATLQTYFDGLYECDTEQLGSVFHEEAHYVSATDGNLLHLDMATYFPIVDGREPGASRGEARADRVVSIEFAGPVTAFARVNCRIGPKHFTDFLTLVHVDGRWQIISKVFHYDLVDDE